MHDPYGAFGAQAYETDVQHEMAPGEAELWLTEIRSHSPDAGRTAVLDVGAGTGLLTCVLKSAGFLVVGLEPSESMIEQGLLTHPELERADFELGHAGQRDLFTADRFDWIVSRQALCHFRDTEKIFSAWRTWLAPGGRLLLVDGLWGSESWSPDDRAELPFASMPDTGPLESALERAGFVVEQAGLFMALNELRATQGTLKVPRYLVRARMRAA